MIATVSHELLPTRLASLSSHSSSFNITALPHSIQIIPEDGTVISESVIHPGLTCGIAPDREQLSRSDT